MTSVKLILFSSSKHSRSKSATHSIEPSQCDRLYEAPTLLRIVAGGALVHRNIYL
jgi:hypothetical protein